MACRHSWALEDLRQGANKHLAGALEYGTLHHDQMGQHAALSFRKAYILVCPEGGISTLLIHWEIFKPCGASLYKEMAQSQRKVTIKSPSLREKNIASGTSPVTGRRNK